MWALDFNSCERSDTITLFSQTQLQSFFSRGRYSFHQGKHMFWELGENLRTVFGSLKCTPAPALFSISWVLEKLQVSKHDGLLCEDFISETVAMSWRLTMKMTYQICTWTSVAMYIMGSCSMVFVLLLGLSPSARHSQDLCCKELLNKKSTIFLFYETSKCSLHTSSLMLRTPRYRACCVLRVDLASRL